MPVPDRRAQARRAHLEARDLDAGHDLVADLAPGSPGPRGRAGGPARDGALRVTLIFLPSFTMLRRLLDTAHLLSLVCWVAALAGAGIAAMGVFSALPEMDIRLPEFAPYFERAGGVPDEELAREHGRVAGGMVMAPVFRWTDRAQLLFAAVAVVTLLLQFACHPGAWPIRRTSNALRALCVIAAASLVVVHAVRFAPRMEESLNGWWDAARRGDHATAATSRAAFDADHFRADALFRARLLLLLAGTALVATASVRNGDEPWNPPVRPSLPPVR